MALPNGAGGYQLGDGNLNEAVLGVQAIPTAYTAAATLTVLNLEQGVIVYTSSSTADLALPTAASPAVIWFAKVVGHNPVVIK